LGLCKHSKYITPISQGYYCYFQIEQTFEKSKVEIYLTFIEMYYRFEIDSKAVSLYDLKGCRKKGEALG
jgi:hypothetical protein